jgi:hypothetical protein
MFLEFHVIAVVNRVGSKLVHASTVCMPSKARNSLLAWQFKRRCSQPNPPVWEENTPYNHCQYLTKQCERRERLTE